VGDLGSGGFIYVEVRGARPNLRLLDSTYVKFYQCRKASFKRSFSAVEFKLAVINANTHVSALPKEQC
jgi:hypothetical protein